MRHNQEEQGRQERGEVSPTVRFHVFSECSLLNAGNGNEKGGRRCCVGPEGRLMHLYGGMVLGEVALMLERRGMVSFAPRVWMDELGARRPESSVTTNRPPPGSVSMNARSQIADKGDSRGI